MPQKIKRARGRPEALADNAYLETRGGATFPWGMRKDVLPPTETAVPTIVHRRRGIRPPRTPCESVEPGRCNEVAGKHRIAMGNIPLHSRCGVVSMMATVGSFRIGENDLPVHMLRGGGADNATVALA